MRPGQEWARPAAGPPDLEVEGDDADLARAVRNHPGALIAYRPQVRSDVGMGIGLRPGATPAGDLEVAMDVLVVGEHWALGCVIVGAPPDELTRWARRRALAVAVGSRAHDLAASSLVVATGQWWRGLDLIPRGHPGDGRFEVQVFGLAPAERAPMRSRLRSGTHVPHPRILELSGRRISVQGAGGLPLRVDDRPGGPAPDPLVVEIRPAAYRLLL